MTPELIVAVGALAVSTAVQLITIRYFIGVQRETRRLALDAIARLNKWTEQIENQLRDLTIEVRVGFGKVEQRLDSLEKERT